MYTAPVLIPDANKHFLLVFPIWTSHVWEAEKRRPKLEELFNKNFHFLLEVIITYVRKLHGMHFL